MVVLYPRLCRPKALSAAGLLSTDIDTETAMLPALMLQVPLVDCRAQYGPVPAGAHMLLFLENIPLYLYVCGTRVRRNGVIHAQRHKTGSSACTVVGGILILNMVDGCRQGNSQSGMCKYSCKLLLSTQTNTLLRAPAPGHSAPQPSRVQAE